MLAIPLLCFSFPVIDHFYCIVYRVAIKTSLIQIAGMANKSKIVVIILAAASTYRFDVVNSKVGDKPTLKIL